MTPSRAIVLAAGLGTRMRPLTDRLPKPLVEVAGRTLVDRALDFVVSAGIAEAVVNTSYLADMLEAHLAGRQDVRVHISREEAPLETGGGIRQALPLLGEAPFFAINSDVICVNKDAHALKRLAAAWDDAAMDALLLLHPREKALGFSGSGDFFLTQHGAVRWRGSDKEAPYVFAGTQLIHPRLFKDAPQGAFSIWRLSDPTKLADGTLPRIHGLVHDGDWLHVGDMAGLAAAERYFTL